jgi:hypothetical protein
MGNFAITKGNLIAKGNIFPPNNIHKRVWTSLCGKYTMTFTAFDRQTTEFMYTSYSSLGGADCDATII